MPPNADVTTDVSWFTSDRSQDGVLLAEDFLKFEEFRAKLGREIGKHPTIEVHDRYRRYLAAVRSPKTFRGI